MKIIPYWLLILAVSIYGLVNCSEVKKKAGEKWNLFNAKVEKLDFLIDEEIDKMLPLDSIIYTKIKDTEEMDSVIEHGSLKLDSVLFKEK